MRIAICDDVKLLRNQVKKLIQAYNDTYAVVEFSDGKELVLAKDTFDLILLDIDMPGMDGLSTAREFRNREDQVPIAFLTSHKELVREVFKVNAFRFLEKPIKPEELYEVMQSAERELQKQERIVIKNRGEQWEIPLNAIDYLEAYGDGTYIYDSKGKVYESSEQLKTWENRLQGKYFFRIHKSFLVALSRVEGIENEEAILFGRKERLKISRRKVVELKEAHWDYIDKHAKVI